MAFMAECSVKSKVLVGDVNSFGLFLFIKSFQIDTSNKSFLSVF